MKLTPEQQRVWIALQDKGPMARLKYLLREVKLKHMDSALAKQIMDQVKRNTEK